MKSLKRVPHSEPAQRARAAAIVEFAVVAPLLLGLVFGIIEYGYLFMVQQSLTNAAREGCRIAILQTTDEPYTEVTNRVAEIMAATGRTTYSVAMTHDSPLETVTVSIPRADVSLVGFGLQEGDLTGVCTMRKEGVVGGG